VRVLTNRHGVRDSAGLHENIESFEVFDVGAVAGRLRAMAEAHLRDPHAGWRALPKVSWFFGGATNLAEVVETVASQIEANVLSRVAAVAPAPCLSVA